MKVIAYAVRADELEAFKKFEKHFNMDITICHDYLSEKTAHLAKGHETVIFIGSCEVTASTLKILSGFGITYMSTRTAGYDNIDKQTAQELGIRIANVPAYSPNSAGEFAILSTISLLLCLLECKNKTSHLADCSQKKSAINVLVLLVEEELACALWNASLALNQKKSW